MVRSVANKVLNIRCDIIDLVATAEIITASLTYGVSPMLLYLYLQNNDIE
jgi:hypothetical protein